MTDDATSQNVNVPPAVQVVPGGPVRGKMRPPGSKSLTNRALICAAFAGEVSTLTGALSSEDTEVMIEALRAIGVEITIADGGQTLHVDPSRRKQSLDQTAELFIANSGTSIRFLTAALSALGGRYRLSGVTRMHARPIGDLIDAISEVVDGSISTELDNGCPPVVMNCKGWSGSEMSVAGNMSSQYLSGLMMAAPVKEEPKPIELQVTGQLVSRPYVDMTAQVMESFGASISMKSLDDEGIVLISRTPYRGTDYSIEPDASAASYFWAAAAITGGDVTVDGLTPDAMQGDVGFVDVLEMMGCDVERNEDSIKVIGKPLNGVDVDMNVISDTVQTLAVVALFADGPTRVRGVAHNRFKETDRIGDLACELRKLGAHVEEHEDGMTITPPQNLVSFPGATLETYHDHRMAMSLALAGLRLSGVRVLDPACTSKTYPDFFHDLELLIGRPHCWSV